MSFPLYNALKKVRNLFGLRPRAPDRLQDALHEDEISDRNGGIKIILNNSNNNNMSMFSYGVGGNEIKVDVNEAIQEIQENKTLMVAQLTNSVPTKPEIITGLRTVEDVFRHFQPSIKVDHETADGQTKKEDFKFQSLADFTPAGITQQSTFLKEMNLQQEQYNTIIRQIKTNKVLRTILENPEYKQAFIQALNAVAVELQNAQ